MLFACALLYGVQSLNRAPGVDYYQFWVMSRAAAGPERASLYSVETSRRIGSEQLARARAMPESSRFRQAAEWNQRTNPDVLDPISTPFYYAVIGALATGNYDRDYWIHQAIGSLVFVSGLIGLCRMLAYPWPATWLAATLVLLWFGPLQSDLQAANVNRVQLGALVGVLWLLRRADAIGFFLAGLCLALLVAYKPNLALVPLLLVVTWAIQRRARALAPGVAGLVAGCAIGALVGAGYFESLGCWADWFEVTRRHLGRPYPLENFNVSLAALVYSLASVNLSFWLTPVVVAGYAACVWMGRRSDDPARWFALDALAIGAGCVVPLLTVQIAWDHYFLLTLLPLLYFLRPAAAVAERLLALAALLVVAQSPLNTLVPLGTATQVAIGFALSTTLLLALTLRGVART